MSDTTTTPMSTDTTDRRRIDTDDLRDAWRACRDDSPIRSTQPAVGTRTLAAELDATHDAVWSAIDRDPMLRQTSGFDTERGRATTGWTLAADLRGVSE